MSRRPISLYDVVADRLSAYSPGDIERLRGHTEKPDPEDRFTALVYERLNPVDSVLDVGCGDGNWLRLVAAPKVVRAIGVDYGIARLEQARDAQRTAPVPGLDYAWADARRLPFADASFTALISRRGPLTASDQYMGEGLRVLKPGGLVFEIGIGEHNVTEVYEVFGRGQMLGQAARGPRIERLERFFRDHGCEPVVAESLTTRMRLPGRDGLVFQLETTPMIEDFDRERDARHVDEVVRRHATEDGLFVTMHRVIVVAVKS
jgi:SAM-dependent methyltransferase